MDAKKLLECVNTKTLEKLGKSVIKAIEITPNGKVKVLYHNGNVKWFINFFQCFQALNYQYNLKLVPAKTSFAKLKDEETTNQDSNHLAALKIRLLNEMEIILDRYKQKKLKYFKNTIFKEMKEVIFDDSDILKLSKKEFYNLRSFFVSELGKKYGRNGHINDILERLKKIQYEKFFD